MSAKKSPGRKGGSPRSTLPAKSESLPDRPDDPASIPRDLPYLRLGEEEDGRVGLEVSLPEAVRIGLALGTRRQDLALRFVAQLADLGLGENREESINVGLALMEALEIRDEAQCLVAMQMLQTHDLVLLELRRARKSEFVHQTDSATNRAAKLMRLFNAQMEALRKMQGKGGVQKVVVQHQHVEVHIEGGRSVVATTQRGGGAD